jgi:tRNA dimethylallyltransferase
MLRDPFTSALILTGPTGSGKTELALGLAQRLDAEIVSVDSMALYRRMDLGTAKPTLEQRQTVRHHLIDVLEPWESGNVAWWLTQAETCCREIAARGKQVLFVGGTPLYLKALLFGLFDGPPADVPLRERLAREAEALGSAALHRRLAQADPAAAARLHPNDLRRIIRALEIFELTGRPISAWQRQWQAPAPRQDSAFPSILWLDLPRPVLYDRINCRVEKMFAAGLIDEVRALRAHGKPLSNEASQALGYKEAFSYLDGQAGLEETIMRVQTRSRNFAKRQITWFRHLPGCRSATAQLTEALWQLRMKM